MSPLNLVVVVLAIISPILGSKFAAWFNSFMNLMHFREHHFCIRIKPNTFFSQRSLFQLNQRDKLPGRQQSQ